MVNHVNGSHMFLLKREFVLLKRSETRVIARKGEARAKISELILIHPFATALLYPHLERS